MSVLNYEHATHFVIKNPITAAALQKRIVHDSAKSQKTQALLNTEFLTHIWIYFTPSFLNEHYGCRLFQAHLL